MKHVLFTTTALVALSGAAMADVTWSGSASIGYNDGHQALEAGDVLADGINTDIDLDVTMSNAGGYSASISAAMEGGGSITGSDISITTPVVTINYGEVVEAANSAYSDTDGLTGLGSDEFTASGAAILISASAGGMSVGYSDDASMEGGDSSSFGISGSVGGVSFGIGSKGDDWGISASGTAMGGTISVASEEVTDASGTAVALTGASVTVPLGDMSLTVSANDSEFWGASVTTSLAGATVSAGTDSNEDNQFSLSTDIAGGFGLAVDFDTSDGSAVGLTYGLSDSATLSVSYYEDLPGDDDGPQTSGTEAKLAFTF